MSRRLAVLILTLLPAACGGGAADPAAGGGGGGGFPPTSVETMTLAEKPIARSSEYIATVRSLRSITIQPQAEGFVTQILVAAGDRVRAGQPLVQIDPDRQRANVVSLESSRAAREAELAFARQQLQRMQPLFEAGAVSRQELEQAETAVKTAEAQLKAIDAQIQEGQVSLRYFTVSAPRAGMVGDILIRVGDRVETSTVITTVDESAQLEAYIAVPLEQSAELKVGLPVELLGSDGQVVAVNSITFVASRADDATQTVLAKSLLRNVPPGIRVQQYVRARVVWSNAPGLAVPVVAVNRVSGGYFVYVAESQDKGMVARQRPVQVGEIVGNEYVIRGGVKAGDRIIVSGIQKIGDGAPVTTSQS
jgi:RND family efflux transporter MFP subunit